MKNEKLKIDIDKRTYEFALRIIQFVRRLPKNMIAQELGRQLLKSGTSIAANVEEAQGGFSKEDFTYKMSTGFKEAKESNLWLKLIYDANIIQNEELKIENEELIKESAEIRNILGTIVKSSKCS